MLLNLNDMLSTGSISAQPLRLHTFLWYKMDSFSIFKKCILPSKSWDSPRIDSSIPLIPLYEKISMLFVSKLLFPLFFETPDSFQQNPYWNVISTYTFNQTHCLGERKEKEKIFPESQGDHSHLAGCSKSYTWMAFSAK